MRLFYGWIFGLIIAVLVCFRTLAFPDISIADFSSPEGTGGTNRMRFVVSVSETSDVPVFVNFATSNGTAIAGLDFSNTVGSVIVPPGAWAATGQVRSATDSLYEQDETFAVHIFAPTNGVIVDDIAIGTIVNDDAAPVLSLAGATTTEGSGGATFMPFVMTLSFTTIYDTVVSFATSNGTAIAGEDFVATSGVATIPSGKLSATVTVEVVTDLLYEGNQHYTLNLFNVSNAAPNLISATGVIVEDDVPPDVSVPANFAQAEGSAGTTAFLIPVSLATNIQSDVAVNFAATSGTADNNDFSPTNGTLVIPAGSSTGFVTVVVSGDTDFEADESFTVTISAPSNAALGNANAAVSILNDDTAADLSISDTALNEGTGGTGTVFLAVSLSAAAPVDVSVNFATAANTATAPGDYLATNGTLVIPAGQTGAVIAVRIVRDATLEPDESFFVQLSSPTNVTIVETNATISLLNDDGDTNPVIPVVSIGDFSDLEGAGEFTFVVSLSQTTTVGVAVGFATSNGIALAGSDYATTNGSLVFAAGTLAQTVTVQVVSDSLFENTEPFFVNLSVPVNATIGDGNGVGTIVDDDDMPVASIATNFIQAEGTSVSNSFLIPITLTTNAGADVIVFFSTIAETATSDDDFENDPGSAVIPAGSTTGFVSVQIVADTTFEFTETFRIQLQSASNATLDVSDCQVSITNDDSGADIAIDDITMPEGSGGPTTLLVRVTLSQPVIADLSVNFATADDTATAGQDYTATNGTLIIPAGETNVWIAVPMNADAAFESDESFTINLTAPTNGIIVDAQSTITLQNDDSAPALSLGTGAQGEGDAGTVEMLVPVTLTAASIFPITVNYETSNDTALAGTDYLATSGTLTIEPGTIATSFVVTLIGDTDTEGDETFYVTLSAPTNATLGTNNALAIIVDDESPPTLSIAAATVTEGQAGTTNLLFPVTLSTNMIIPVTVAFTTTNGTADSGTDYSATNGTLLIPAGTRTGYIAVAVSGDTDFEGNETLGVVLSAPVHATLATTNATGTILNDDIPPVVSVAPTASRSEGTGDQVEMEFPLTLNVPVSVPVVVFWTTTNGTAISGPDFDGGPASATIAANTTTGAIYVSIFGDTEFEGDETFTLHLTSASNASIGAATSAATIFDDETPPDLTPAPTASITEGTGTGHTNLLVPVVLSSNIGTSASVNFQSLELTATAGTDYLSTNGTLVIPAGTRTGFVTIAIARDALFETAETLALQFTAPTNCNLTSTQTLVTITNDDAPPALSIASVAQLEGQNGTTDFIFPVTLNAPAGLPVTVEYVTSNGTANSATDYTAATGSLLIAAGETTGLVTIAVNGDGDTEVNETFLVHLFAPTNATLAAPTATGTILDDETLPDLTIGSATQLEGNVGTTLVQLPVILDTASASPVTVAFATSNGTALAGTDYLATNGVLTIPAGTRTGFIAVAISGDTAYEFDDLLHLTLSNATGANITTANGTITIPNDDALPAITITPAAAFPEGDADTADHFLSINLAPPAGVDVTVEFSTSNGTALAASDYLVNNGTAYITAGTTNSIVSLTILGDTQLEADETLTLLLHSPTNATLSTTSSTITILNDEPVPNLTVANAALAEGNAGTTLLQIPVILSATSPVPVTVSFVTSNATALAASDYIATNGTLVIAPGSRTGIVTIALLGDTTYELPETLTLNLHTPFGAQITNAQGTATILNDDTAPALSINDLAQLESDTGTTDYTFTISLTATAGAPVTVNFATSNGTANSASDYTANSGILTIPEGEISATLNVTANGDTALEADETFSLNLFTPTNATLADPSGLGTIQNDDGVPELTIAPVTQSEGNGTTTFLFPVTLSTPAGIPVTVAFVTSNETATAGSDYTARTGTLTVAAGQTTTSIAITITGDATFEPDETFTLHLFNPTNATLATNTALGTILNDDTLPTLSIGSISQPEGSTGDYTRLLPVVLSTNIGNPVSLNFQTLENSALEGTDYTATNGTLVIPAGTRTGFIAIVISGDLSFETNESFTVILTSPTNATLATATGTVTLVNDDTIPTLTIQPVSQNEGDSGLTTYPVPVTVSIPAGVPLTVQFATSNGTALSGTDYAATNGTLVIPPGAASADIAVMVFGDTTYESTETLHVRIFAPTNATITTSNATVTIFNDEALPEITIADAAELERGPGTNTTLLIPVTLDYAFPSNITVQFATSNGTAVSGTDYVSTNGTLTILAGTRTGLIAVVITGDALAEDDETFTLNLFNPTNASIADGSAQITILNDEGFPAIAIADFARAEATGGAATNFFRIPVILSFPIGATATVSFSVSPGTAIEGTDYTATNGTLFIPPNTRTGFIAVAVAPDTTYEHTETFTLSITDPVNGTITNADATISIHNDDAPPAATITGGSISEPDFGTDTLDFTVTLNATSEFDSVFAYATSNRSALAETDYNSSTGTLTFTPGQTTAVLTITINGDTTYESNETFTVNLYAPSEATIASPTAIGTILNNDPAPDLTIGNVTQTEGTGGTTTFLVPVDLFFAHDLPVTVAYTTSNGTALAGSDFTAASGTLVIQPGQTSTSIAITVAADYDIETDETFTLEFSNPINATLPNPTATLTIENDDSTLPDITLPDFAKLEGTGGTTNFLVPVTLSFPLGTTATVNFTLSPGTAEEGTDYTATNGTLHFLPGTQTGFITIAISPDTTFETNETLTLNLDTPVTANLPDPDATLTILNDDAPPAATLTGGSITEPDFGTDTLNFTVTLDRPSAFDATFTFATSNGTAVSETDYLSTTNTLTITAGQTTGIVSVTINGDTTYEADETFTLNLSAPVDATIATPTATGTLLNTDTAPEITFGNFAQLEGTGTNTTFLFPINLSTPSELPVTVAFTTSDGDATAPTDYTTRTGILVIAAGQTETTLAITVTADAEIETDETFNLLLTDPVNATLPFNTAFLTILTDDFPPPTFADYDDYAAQIPATIQRGYTNDPDADGYPNLLEYVTGGNPTNTGHQSRILITYTDEIPTLRFTRTTYSTDTTLIIETAETLTNDTEWTGIATNLLGSWGDSPNILETGDAPHLTVTLTAPPTTNLHLRLRITRP